ncbi:MAG: TIGR04283 family arsenosugar biosynthesis glycosyltransferase [Thermodesulfovibrionales bacterium]|nr:TIGR04283 family arsenosugar biosynthesis glycosyltransferase [Thermodesulfovibrionales bacterium]
MHISVIIPVFNEQATIVSCIDSVRKLNTSEIIVVDGGSSDKTCELAKSYGAKVIHSQKGRGVQLARGAIEAKGDLLLFVHADARLPEGLTNEDLIKVIKDGYVGGFFNLRFDSNSLSIRLVETFANLRSRLFSLPYGDQAIFVSKRVYEEVGGFKEYPFLEDLDFVIRIKKVGRLKMINKFVTVSSRRLMRWYPLSPIAVSLRNVLIALLFILGFKPEKLVRLYK